MTDIDMDAVIAELRKPNGWWKGSYGSYSEGDGPCCLIGAFARVSGLRPIDVENNIGEDDPLIQAIRSRFPERIDPECPSVVDFNDDEDTTLNDVIAVVEKARAAQGKVRHV